MAAQYAEIKTLQRLLLGDIFVTLGLTRDGWARRHLWPLVWLPAHIFSRISARFDEMVAKQGFDVATQWVVPRFVKNIATTGDQYIPTKGPLLVVSNHPGSIDSLIIASRIPRKDFRIVASTMPFVMNMPATAQHLFFASRDTFDRMGLLRSAVEHLRGGGSMLLFPSGHVDPDPCLHAGAEASFSEWSRSVELLLRKVPETQLLISIVSNVVGREFFNNPITRIQKGLREKLKLAQLIQLMQQMVLPGSVNVIPRVSFEIPVTVEKLHDRMDHSIQIMQSIAERARLALKHHMSAQFQRWDRLTTKTG